MKSRIDTEFSGFSVQECRIDDFYSKTVGIAKYKELSFILKLLLIMSHGQAAVERGFSPNAILKTNMSPETVVSKRMIKDHMFSFNLKPYTIENSVSILDFIILENSLSDFYSKTVGIAKYKELSFILKLLLIMSHAKGM